MTGRRFIVRLQPDGLPLGAHPAYLLKRLPSDRRAYDYDLGMPYDIQLWEGRSSSEELFRRSFAFPEAAAAAREWLAFASSLNIMHGDLPTPSLELVEPGITTTLRGQAGRALRLVPLMNDQGPVELLHAVAAWPSSREAAQNESGETRLLYVPPISRFETSCAQVHATYTAPGEPGRHVVGRLYPSDPACRLERFGFYERAWTRSFYQGLAYEAACSLVMTLSEAHLLARAMKSHSEFADVRVESLPLRSVIDSAEFGELIWGTHTKWAADDLREAVGQGLYWVFD